MDAMLLVILVVRLLIGPQILVELIPGIKPSEGSLILKVAGANPERTISIPCHEVLLKFSNFLIVYQLNQVALFIHAVVLCLGPGKGILADEVVVVAYEDKVLGNILLPPNTLIILTSLSIWTMTVIHALHTFVVGVAFGEIRVTGAQEIIPLPIPA